MPLSAFHPLIAEWFTGRFGSPTEPQIKGWSEIATGRDVLISAPTGSGKTLAAFLICLDSLVRQSREGTLPSETQVVYVSPLKALSTDIHKNLETPLAEMDSRKSVPQSAPATPPGERQRLSKKPAPHPGDHPGIALHPAHCGTIAA